MKVNLVKSTILFRDKSQSGRLIRLTAIFLVIFSLALTFAPTAITKQFQISQLEWKHWIGFFAWFLSFSVLFYFLDKERIKRDMLLLPLISLMSGWGLLMVWRLAPSLGIKQSIWLLLSIGMVILALPHQKKILIELRRHKYIWLFAGLTITALTFIFGTNPTNFGPKLWLGCCGFYFQPSEPLKLLLILFLAAYFADRQPFSKKLIPLITPTLIMAGLAFLILIFQRDLGTAFVFIFIFTSIVYIATGKKLLLLTSFLFTLISTIIGYRLFDVVQLRIDAWLNPWQDPSGRSYQIVQSIISLAAGGMTGRGPGMGSPNLVPIAFSDFIFSAIAEEFGFPGTIGLVILFIIFTFRGLSIALRARDNYQRYLSAGLTIFIASQTILIIGGNIRLLPLTGVTLPFFSYGGSSLLTSFLAYFLIISVNQNTTETKSLAKDPAPIVHLSSILLAGFISITFVNAWWSIYRGPDLLSRTDNARRTISDQYNERGEILDRNLTPLSQSKGTPGDYQRTYSFQEFAPTIGYTHTFYGQAGAEASLDTILRGLEFQSPWIIWYYHLLYGQSPPGLDVQLTLDLELQSLAANFFSRTSGAAVLINAQSGEIYVLYSSPDFDANNLEQIWEDLQNDKQSPLINRATQSLYPPGGSLAPFLIAETSATGSLPSQIEKLSSAFGDNQIHCTGRVLLPTTWAIVGRYGCPGPLEYLGQELGPTGLENLFLKLGFYQVPDIRIDLSPPYIPTGITNPSMTAIGQSDVFVTPLQLAISAAALSNSGVRPSPQLHLATKDSQGIWVHNQTFAEDTTVFSPETATSTANTLKNPSLPIWETTAFAITEMGAPLTWYIGGTLPEQEQSYSIVVVLEKENTELATLIGQRLLSEVLKSD